MTFSAMHVIHHNPLTLNAVDSFQLFIVKGKVVGTVHFIASTCIFQGQSPNSVRSFQFHLHTGQSANTALNCSGPAQDNGLLRGWREDLREGWSHMLHFLKAAKTLSGSSRGR